MPYNGSLAEEVSHSYVASLAEEVSYSHVLSLDGGSPSGTRSEDCKIKAAQQRCAAALKAFDAAFNRSYDIPNSETTATKSAQNRTHTTSGEIEDSNGLLGLSSNTPKLSQLNSEGVDASPIRHLGIASSVSSTSCIRFLQEIRQAKPAKDLHNPRQRRIRRTKKLRRKRGLDRQTIKPTGAEHTKIDLPSVSSGPSRTVGQVVSDGIGQDEMIIKAAHHVNLLHSKQVQEQVEKLSSAEDNGSQGVACQGAHLSDRAGHSQETAGLETWKFGLLFLPGAKTSSATNGNASFESLDAHAGATCLAPEHGLLGFNADISVHDENAIFAQSESSVEASDHIGESTSEGSGSDDNRFLPPFLDGRREAIVDSLIQEAWMILNKGWTPSYTTCAGNVPTSSSPPQERSSASGSRFPHKRQRQQDDDDNFPNENNGRTPKRSPPKQGPLDSNKRRLQLACPFRKHEPRKYRFPEFSSCARSSWHCVGRVKEHIYRSHRVPIHCTRCWMTFANQGLLDSHSREETEQERCQVKPEEGFDGITLQTEKLLRCRKKDYPGQSEPELWKKMYRVLFPDEIIPSPYFEAMLDESANRPDLIEQSHYDAYCRRELPRVIRSNLESAVASQLQVIESALRAQLDGIIERSLKQVSSDYQTSITTMPLPSRALGPPTPAEFTDGPNEVENIADVQQVSEYYDNLNHYHCQEQTPAGLSGHENYGQQDDLRTGQFSFEESEALLLNPRNAPGCFCPFDACNCLRQIWNGQRQEYYLPPATFQLKTPPKVLERGPVLDNWNLDEFLADASSDIDKSIL